MPRDQHPGRILLSKAVAILLFAGWTTSAAAVDYYVSPSGDDAAGGTSPATAWRTAGRVNAHDFDPGDRVLFEGGTTFPGTVELDAADAGTATLPVEIRSFGSGRATIEAGDGHGISVTDAGGIEVRGIDLVGAGPAANRGAGVFFYTERADGMRFEHVRIVDVDTSGFGMGGIVIASYHASLPGFRDVEIARCRVFDNATAGISVWGFFVTGVQALSHEDVRIAHCAAFDNLGNPGAGAPNTANGIVVSATDRAMIEFNHAYRNGGLDSRSRGGPIGIWAWQSNAVAIQFNVSHDNRSVGGTDGGGFDLDGGMTHSVLQYNYSYRNDGAGYLAGQFPGAAPFHDNTVRYNVSHADGGANGYGGVVLFSSAGLPVSDVHVYGNTLHSAHQGAPPVHVFEGVYERIDFRNNLLVTAPDVRLVRSLPTVSPAMVVFQGNLYWAEGGGFEVANGGAIHSSLAAWQATGQEQVGAAPVGLHANPLLVSPGQPELLTDPKQLAALRAYRLAPGSPAIDAGLDLRGVFGIDTGPHDFYGTVLPTGATLDVGAAELIPESAGNGVASQKLVVGSQTKRGTTRTVYVAKNRGAGITKGPGTDVDGISAEFHVAYDTLEGAFLIPPGRSAGRSGWRANRRSFARYVNRDAPGGPTGAAVAIVRADRVLKLVGKSRGDVPLDLDAAEPSASVFTVYVVANGGATHRHCSRFPPGTCKLEGSVGAGRSLVCRGGVPDPACAALPTSPAAFAPRLDD